MKDVVEMDEGLMQLAVEHHLPRSPKLIRAWAMIDDRDFKSYALLIGSKQILPVVALQCKTSGKWRVSQIDQFDGMANPKFDINSLDSQFRIVPREELDLPFISTFFVHDNQGITDDAMVRFTLLGDPNIDYKRMLIAEKIYFENDRAYLDRIWDFSLSIQRSIQAQTRSKGQVCNDGNAMFAVWESLHKMISQFDPILAPFE